MSELVSPQVSSSLFAHNDAAGVGSTAVGNVEGVLKGPSFQANQKGHQCAHGAKHGFCYCAFFAVGRSDDVRGRQGNLTFGFLAVESVKL